MKPPMMKPPGSLRNPGEVTQLVQHADRMHILKKENERRLVEIIEQTPGNPDRDTVMCGITKEGIRALLVRMKAEFEAGTFSHDLCLTHETLKGAKELSDITMDHVVHM